LAVFIGEGGEGRGSSRKIEETERNYMGAPGAVFLTSEARKRGCESEGGREEETRCAHNLVK